MTPEDRIKVTLVYNISSRVEAADYEEWAKKSVVPLSRAKGLIDARAYRNALQPSQVKIVTTWRSFLDWGRFVESEVWQDIKVQLTASIATDIDVCVWKPSPLFPELMKYDAMEKKKPRKK